ncbi:hypothetical protein [Chryseolinea lacunae]|uniref:Uncharacterized protein n=1 Tax=Chryseolinea lacunae TaxID=2801331 RepID=A0ABS1L086_9BACT|nr:hypothetical protein [Chryseolinea lacunae]MBL0745128.1 hypothetical protein [Chryseolinea lacunae]
MTRFNSRMGDMQLRRRAEHPMISVHRGAYAFLHNDYLTVLNASWTLSLSVFFRLTGTHTPDTIDHND